MKSGRDQDPAENVKITIDLVEQKMMEATEFLEK